MERAVVLETKQINIIYDREEVVAKLLRIIQEMQQLLPGRFRLG